MSIIGDGIVLGTGGETASIFVTGLSQTDTVTASKDGKTVVGKWTQIHNPASVVPDGYTQLEYIESTGTQYIDTEYMPKPHTTMEAELLMSGAFKNVANYGGNSNLFNVVDGESQYGMNFGGGSDQGNEVFVWLNKINGASGTEIQSFTITDTIRTNRNKLVVGKRSISWGTASRSVTAKTTTQTTSLVLFGSKKAGVISAFTSYNMRVFSWQIKENGTLVRDFIPTKRISDNAIGLYDKVENKFYANAGTGTFTAGAEIPQTIDGFLIDKIKDYGTWTVTATDGTNTSTQDVLVDSAMQYDIELSYKMWLYRDGDECEAVTGGWSSPSIVTADGYLDTYRFDCKNDYGTPTRTKNANNLYLKTVQSSSSSVGICAASFWAKNGIDLTDFSTLHIKANVISPNPGIRIYTVSPIKQTVTVQSTDNMVANFKIENSGEQEVSYDISNLTGVFYIGALVVGWSEGVKTKEVKIYKIWLE